MEKKKSTLTNKMRENPWIASTLFLGILVLILMVGNFVEEDTWQKNICQNIRGTPSWVKDGVVFDSGYTNFGNQSLDVVNDVLIPQEIYFIYSSNCGWCEKQIDYFGTTWGDYVDAGLTIDCSN